MRLWMPSVLWLSNISRMAALRTLARRSGRCCTSWRTGSMRGSARAIRRSGRCLLAKSLLASKWYRERLHAQQAHDTALWKRHEEALEKFLASGLPAPELMLHNRLAEAREQLSRTRSDTWLAKLKGTIGADPAAIA